MPKYRIAKEQGNRLLGALEPTSRKRIDPHLEPVNLKLGAVVCDAGGLLKHAYFPEGSVLSLLTVLENGSAIVRFHFGMAMLEEIRSFFEALRYPFSWRANPSLAVC
jgi:hypothetical protein